MGSLSPAEAKEFMARHGTPIRTFVETGTHMCTTLLPIYESGLFERIHSIELSDVLYSLAAARLRGSSVVLHQGDSADVLVELATEIDEPALFWLDAHWYNSEDVARGLCPLFAELGAIATRAQADLIVIDDVQCFGKKWDDCLEADWTGIDENTILSLLGRARTSAHYVSEHKLIVHRSSRQSG